MNIKASTINEIYVGSLLPQSPILLSIQCLHQGENALENITIRIQCLDDYIYFDDKQVTYIPHNKEYTINDFKYHLHLKAISQLQEATPLIIKIQVYDATQNLIASVHTSTILHPIDSFEGLANIASLCSFVLPHHAYIYYLKQQTVKYLQKFNNATSFEGYQSLDKQRIVSIITALFYALKEEKWIYSALPPSYSTKGQRLRLVPQIASLRFGNCIDISLLISAVLEAMNLHPLILLTPGHAFVGCWLVPERLESVVTHHKNPIANRLAKGIQDILVFESTSVCVGSGMNFKDAVAAGERWIIGEKRFQGALDIKTGRLMGYQALPIFGDTTHEHFFNSKALKDTQLKEETLILEPSQVLKLDESINKSSTKSEVWQHKLLDLTLRNTLLNIRPNNNAIQLLNTDFELLLQYLENGRTLHITHTKALDVYAEKRSLLDTIHESDPLYAFVQEELKVGRLLSAYTEADLQATLTAIYRNNLSAIEETGANSLYLSLGVLKWYEPEVPDKQRIAPLILIPVSLQRKTLLSKFTIKFREETIVFNDTLLAFLEQEFQLSLRNLAAYMKEDESWNIPAIFNTIRSAIDQHKHWEVDELVFLANFNFSTQVLWHDIKTHKDIMQEHPIIKGFVHQSLPKDESLILPATIDTIHYDTQEHVFPLDADSSQKQAIIAANLGNSFVLHGPPGTGKSQTITNIIANFLNRKKRVLFVSAKKAALDVVYNRLKNIGLERFILELHSNKSKKSTVLEHLDTTFSLLKLLEDDAFIKAAAQMKEVRQELQLTLEALHQKSISGYSVYDLILLLEELDVNSDTTNYYSFPREVLLSLNRQTILSWQKFIQNFAFEPILLQTPQDHPLNNFTQIKEIVGRNNFINKLNLKTFHDLKTCFDKLYNVTKNQLFKQNIDIPKFSQFLDKFEQLRAWPITACNLHKEYREEAVGDVINLIQQKETLENALFSRFNKTILSIDITITCELFNKAKESWFLPQFFRINAVKKLLNKHTIEQAIKRTEIPHYLNILQKLVEINNTLDIEDNKIIISFLNKLLIKPFTAEEWQKAAEQMAAFKQLAADVGMLSYLKKSARSASIDKRIADVIGLDFMNHAYDALQTFGSIEADWAILQSHFVSTHPHPDGYWETWYQHILLLQTHIDEVDNWAAYCNSKSLGNKLGLGDFIKSIENKEINKDNLIFYFQASLYTSLLEYTVRNAQSLRTFSGQKIAQLVAQLKDLQSHFTEVSKREIYIRCLQQLPNAQYADVENSERYTLQRAIKSKGRNWTLRNLFLKTPNVLPKLAPCMLMSPLSVAQYLDISLPKFDVVIFDEASQLPTAEAVSAIARAKQVIIVGDPKQLPPTSFFSSQTSDEAYSDLDDLESILDDTLALGLPSMYLLRHYRSQHESLISFSNQHFYNDTLFTFPSANDRVAKISLTHVPGYYDKGVLRHNKFEAEAIVQEVLKRLKAPSMNGKTMGIVTFSQAQQRLIEDKLEEMLVQNPDVEAALQALDAPIFVKNLENVQGDERDVILFSIGYGPNKLGELRLNFGPLNKDGGWRRLNVAITRAKHEMMIFATLQPEQIDLRRTQSKGLVYLKAFLEYARNEANKPMLQQVMPPKDALIAAIGKRLAQENFKVHYNVGRSQFKIEIAVVDPRNPHAYLLGIIVDSENFLNAGNVTDRFLIIPTVLENLDWKLIYLWTIDWYFQPEAEVQKLLKTIEVLMNTQQQPALPPNVVHQQCYVFNPESLQEVATQEELSDYSSNRKTYEIAVIPKAASQGADAFLHRNNKEIVKNQILRIVDKEGPIAQNILQKKLLDAWHIVRSGARIERYIMALLNELEMVQSKYLEKIFVWMPKSKSADMQTYRVMPKGMKRSFDDVCPEEYGVCLKEVLKHHITLPKEVALKYLQNTLLNSKYSSSQNAYLEAAIQSVIGLYKIEQTATGYKIIS